jgi:hypothetical protein
MSELNKRAEFSHYDSMTTEELQEILRKHAHGELETEPDTDELYYIMEVLAQRKEMNDPQAFRSDEEALADFRKYYMPQEKNVVPSKVIRFPSCAFKAVAAVLVAVLIFAVSTSITAEAFHIDIWSKFANWTKEIFQFTDLPQGTKPENPEKEYNAELKSLQDALVQEKIEEKLVPEWLPEGYKSIDLQIVSTPRVRNISAVYEKEGSDLIIKIRQTIGVQAPQVEKNDDFLELYVVDGVEYYIFSNNAMLQAVWSIGEFECLIAGEITVEEMKMMINSIK